MLRKSCRLAKQALWSLSKGRFSCQRSERLRNFAKGNLIFEKQKLFFKYSGITAISSHSSYKSDQIIKDPFRIDQCQSLDLESRNSRNWNPNPQLTFPHSQYPFSPKKPAQVCIPLAIFTRNFKILEILPPLAFARKRQDLPETPFPSASTKKNTKKKTNAKETHLPLRRRWFWISRVGMI